MRQTLISIAVLTALSLPGLASAEVGSFNTENTAHPLGIALPGHEPALGSAYYVITLSDPVKKPQPGKAGGAGVAAPRDAASGQATGIQSPRDPASGLPTGKRR
jgi:hypothetical protein